MSERNASTETAEHAVLRSLALKAAGLSGADVERLVREARQRARRERRGLGFSDLHAGLALLKPDRPEALRRRMAIHEAGHAVAHLHFGLSSITAITIDGPSGGYIEGETDHIDILTEDRVAAVLVIKLAGRAAEEEFLGSVSAGSGGSSESDLAKSTELALAMETALGFSTETPLLYRHTEERTALLTHHSRLADRVNARLENAYRQARDLVRSNRDAVQLIVEALLRYGTLEGQQLEPVLATVRDQIPAGCPR